MKNKLFAQLQSTSPQKYLLSRKGTSNFKVGKPGQTLP